MDKGAQTALDYQTVLRVAKKHNVAVIKLEELKILEAIS
jgi:hypothetical protein